MPDAEIRTSINEGRRTTVGAGPSEAASSAEEAPGREHERAARRFRGSSASAAEREGMLRELRAIEFPVGLRGYDRSAVDRYVEQVNRLIAELEISSSPEAAVRHALDEVSEETREILQRAHQTAEDIATRSRLRAEERVRQADQEAERILEEARRESAELSQTTQRETTELRETTQRETTQWREAAQHEIQSERDRAKREAEDHLAAARREAESLVEAAEGTARELGRGTETIWRERRRLIEDVRSVGEQLVGIGEIESKRFAHFDFEAILKGERHAPSGVAAHAARDETAQE